MKLQRTGNAGVLLELDGTRVLLDGLCGSDGVYMGTSPQMQQMLRQAPPDVLLFTHGHIDHYQESLVSPYKNSILRPVVGPENVPLEPFDIGNLTITPIRTRHLGKVEPGLSHHSFLISGTKTVLFTGDAAPAVWKDFPSVDTVVVPFAYCTTPSAWKTTQDMGKLIVLVHTPACENDPHNLWSAIHQTVCNSTNIRYLEVEDIIDLSIDR